MKESCVKCSRKKHRSEEEKKNLKRRLNIIEGQVRGITAMIDDDRYCDEILIQISAINKSLKSICNEIFKNHLSTCVVDDIKNGRMEIINEIMDIIGHF